MIKSSADASVKGEIEALINGEEVEKTIRQDLTYRDMYVSVENIRSVLFTIGYLTYKERISVFRFRLVILSIRSDWSVSCRMFDVVLHIRLQVIHSAQRFCTYIGYPEVLHRDFAENDCKRVYAKTVAKSHEKMRKLQFFPVDHLQQAVVYHAYAKFLCSFEA